MPRGIPNARSIEDEPLNPEQVDDAADLSKQPKYELLIHRTNVKNEMKRVNIGVNGHFFSILRGEKVIVPKAVVDALKDAVELRYEALPDGSLGPAQTAMSYPFQATPL